jgi:hypothetical protein
LVEKGLETFKALVDDAFRDCPLKARQVKGAEILSTAHGLLSRRDFKELERYVLGKVER